MTSDSPGVLIEAVENVLDRERLALIRGDLDRLQRLLPEKTSLIERLNEQDQIEQLALQHVQDKLQRNQVLLNSAMEGIRAVAERMSALRQIRQGLDIYDPQGRKHRFTAYGPHTVEKRA